MKRLIALAVTAVLLASGVTLVARRPHAAAPEPAPAPLPDTSLTIVVGHDGLQPPRTSVPKDHRVSLTFVNHSGRAIVVSLAGYDPEPGIGRLEDGDTWCGAFTSDRPGDDFAWIVDGKPAGRLAVSGPHLTEGHR